MKKKAPPIKRGPKIDEFRLGNDLRGIVIEDRRAPVVTHMVWYPVGGADDPAGRSGLAHFLEHMMFKGTECFPDEEFSRTVSKNGGQLNAFTSYDYTAYYENVARERLSLMMELEADRMAGVTLAPEDIESECNVILEERNERIEVHPEILFRERLEAELYASHPYGRPLIGRREEIKAIERDDLAAFHRQHYAPDQALLTVAGDIDVEDVERLAEKTYGALEPSGAKAPVRSGEPLLRGARRIEMRDRRAVKPYFQRDYLVPSRHAIGPEDAAAFAIFAEVLGCGPDSRLGQSLVETGRAHKADTYYNNHFRDHNSLIVTATPTENVTLEEIEKEIDQEIGRLFEEGPSQDELTRLKTLMLADEIYRLDSSFALACLYGEGLSLGESIETIRTWPERIQAITATDIQRTVQKHLQLERSATGYLRLEAVEGT